MNENKVLCGASHYEQKFYINPQYDKLPSAIKDELKAMCVLFVEEVSGIMILEFDDDGNLKIVVTSREDDFYYDEIGSRLKVKQIQAEKRELFEQLEQFYKAFILGMDL